MPKNRRAATDPSSHHGFLDSLDDSEKGEKRKRSRGEDEDDSLDLDRIL